MNNTPNQPTTTDQSGGPNRELAGGAEEGIDDGRERRRVQAPHGRQRAHDAELGRDGCACVVMVKGFSFDVGTWSDSIIVGVESNAPRALAAPS